MTRNLFLEIQEGFEALQQSRKEYITLKNSKIEVTPIPEMAHHELVELRQKLSLSQAVFAHYLHINKRTLENWEQGRTKPNAQAAVLLRLVEKYPETLEKLANL